MKGSSGQVEINETLLTVFIIVIILIIGIVVYFRFSLAHVDTVAGELSEQESTVLLSRLTSLPELSCAQRECIDTSKILPFQQALAQNMDYYRTLFGAKKIVIEQVYPLVERPNLCTIDTYQQERYPDSCSSWTVYEGSQQAGKKGIAASTFVSLYFPERDEYRIGRLEVTVYG